VCGGIISSFEVCENIVILRTGGLMGVLGNRKQGHSVSSRLREGSRFVHLKSFVYM